MLNRVSHSLEKGWFDLAYAQHACSVRLTLPDGSTVEATKSDLFEALRTIRREIESRDLVLLCNGSRRDVYPPSGLTRQWIGGRKAYILRLHVEPNMDDVVDIFAPTQEEFVASVQEQRAYFEAWWLNKTGRLPAGS